MAAEIAKSAAAKEDKRKAKKASDALRDKSDFEVSPAEQAIPLKPRLKVAAHGGPPPKPRLKSQAAVHRDWFTTSSKRRCQHVSKKKQCKHEANKGFVTCSAHSGLESAVREELQAPYGPVWMKRLKRYIMNRFRKDLDFWTQLPLSSWIKASDVIDVALDMVPERKNEIYAALGEASEDEGLKPAARLARTMLREKFMLNASEQTKLREADQWTYDMWKQVEFYAIFGYNGNGKRQPVRKPAEHTSIRPSDNRTRDEIKTVRPSIVPEGQIMFLEVRAIEVETRLFSLLRSDKRTRDRFNKSPLDMEISTLYHRVGELTRELESIAVPHPLMAKELKTLKHRLDELIEKRKFANEKASCLKQQARDIRARQSEIMGGKLQGSIIEGCSVGPEKWYWKISATREDKPKRTKLIGNRGKHSSKRTSKKHSSKGVAGSGHNANVRSRIGSKCLWVVWDDIIADNSKYQVDEVVENTLKLCPRQQEAPPIPRLKKNIVSESIMQVVTSC